MNVNVIGSNTEIYSGVGFLTQAAPTNFHVFMKRKVLAKDEAADDWREETEAEKKCSGIQRREMGGSVSIVYR